jgi:hypothetical protein
MSLAEIFLAIRFPNIIILSFNHRKTLNNLSKISYNPLYTFLLLFTIKSKTKNRYIFNNFQFTPIEFHVRPLSS